MEENSVKAGSIDEELSEKFIYNYFTAGIIIGVCKWIIIAAHIFCYNKNGASLLPVVEQSDSILGTSIAHTLNIAIPLYMFLLGSQNYYLTVLEKKSFKVRRNTFKYMATPGIIYILLSTLLNFIGVLKYPSGTHLGMSPNIIFSIIKPGFLSFFLLAYLAMLFFSPFVDISIPSKGSIMEFKRFMSSSSNFDSNLEKGVLIEKHVVEFNNSDKVKLTIGTYSIIKCIISSICVVYLLNFLYVSDSCIFKFFMFASIIILTLSVGSFAFKEYLMETYVLLIMISVIWSFIYLQGNSIFKSEISDLICSTLSVYLTMYTAGHFFSCIGMEVIEPPSYCFLFIPVTVLGYYNISSCFVTISPIFYPFYHCNISFQKTLVISWLSIIPIISFCLNLCIYIKNKTIIWLISSLPDNIILFVLSLAPLFELCISFYIHPII
ncbi:membrane associated with 11 transmembrane domains regions [Cryptosporidium sp. chipmunk genotype I]|uniref:membrane associated with 11 transmembrane domains regions n=1 Tax=Cryptosporidium sp. chipmunk genotype I TaxID=1280935 RepID=UPI00351A2E3A|nr:membrane associated with 11 transmembrane domains regions [Cryptosporidium sp. chipmunk genotype I]